MVETFTTCFVSRSSSAQIDRYIRWNNDNHSWVILNVDGSCHGSPIRAGFGGIFRNNSGYYLSGFSDFIQNSSDILLAELFAILHGLTLAKDMDFETLICYFNSLHCINVIKGPNIHFHVHVVLIQHIKELFSHNNVTICHTLRGKPMHKFLS
jgi:ribonuclease HI